MIEDTGNELSSNEEDADEEESKDNIYNYLDTGRGSSSKFLESDRTSSINSEIYGEEDNHYFMDFHHKQHHRQKKNNPSAVSASASSGGKLESRGVKKNQ